MALTSAQLMSLFLDRRHFIVTKNSTCNFTKLNIIHAKARERKNNESLLLLLVFSHFVFIFGCPTDGV